MLTRDSTMRGPNVLRLGIFGANCSSGQAITMAPERWIGSWDDNEAIAQLADEAGIEFMLPIARWRGYGGKTDFHNSSFETMTWAAGLLARTKRLNVLSTIHVPLVHPVIAAKQLVTIDHMSRGRVGFNIVCGWNADEFDMFGLTQREHDTRYRFGQEWLDIVEGIWQTSSPFDFRGEFFDLKGVVGQPQPWGKSRPIIMNAGASTAGRAFGIRNCDVLFTIVVDLEKSQKEIFAIKQQAAARERAKLEVFTACYIVCRPTQADAESYHHYYAVEMADAEAVEKVMVLQGLHTQGRPPELQQKFKERFAGGHGTYPVIGTPDTVAALLADIARAGIDGVSLGFVNYKDELPYFIQEVLPRLERMSLRAPNAEA